MKKILIIILMMGKLFAIGTIMIEVAYEGENYSIERAWALEQTFPPTLQGAVESEDDIIIKLKDSNGTVVDELRIENPRIVRGILPEIGDEEGHENIKEQKGSFVLRYAYEDGLKYLNIINATNIKLDEKQAPAPQEKTSVVADMEFGSLLNN